MMSTFQSSCSLGRRGTPGGVSITFDSYELPETESMPPLYSAHDPRQGGLIVHPVNYEEDVDAVSLSPLAALCRLPRENSSSAAEPGGKFRFAEVFRHLPLRTSLRPLTHSSELDAFPPVTGPRSLLASHLG